MPNYEECQLLFFQNNQIIQKSVKNFKATDTGR